MTRGKGNKRPLTIAEIQGFKEEKSEIDATLRHLEENPGTAHGSEINTEALKKQSDYFGKVIAEGAPREVRGLNRDRMAKEAVELREKLQKNLPTREEMDHPARNPGAVAKHLKWLKANEGSVARYKEIQRSLEPDDPTATDVEKLRREK